MMSNHAQPIWMLIAVLAVLIIANGLSDLEEALRSVTIHYSSHNNIKASQVIFPGEACFDIADHSNDALKP